MQTSALRFQGYSKGEQPTPSELSFQSTQDLQEFRAGNPQVAFVLPVEHLKQLREFKDAVIDRVRKNTNKGLSEYLLGQKKIPIIDGNYGDIKKVKGGIRSLLENASQAGEDNLYLIGVETNVFQKLYSEASDRASISGKVRRTSRAFKAALTRDFAKDALLQLIGSYRIPPRLSQAYVGGERDVQLVLQMAMAAAGSNGPVLILGETGTGKEIIAREIHSCGSRAALPFQVVNCAAIPTDLLESELFGHVKGAFTGALSDREGAFERVKGGTLFLDEIGDMPLRHQAKILRAIDGKPFFRVGGSTGILFKGRLVAATNRDISAMMVSNQFREDLYYRLRGLVIRTPALRNHPEDIRAVATHLWVNKIAGKKAKPLSEKVLRELKAYPWQGNVRQLKTVLSQAFALFGEALRVEHIRVLWLSESDLSQARQPAPQGLAPSGPLWVDHLDHLRQIQELINAIRENLSPLARRRLLEDSAVAAMQQSIQNRLDELNVLCHNQERLKSKSLEVAAPALSGLISSMRYLHILLQKDVENAIKRRKSLEPELKEMEAVITKAADKLMRMI
jgi:DNA-binding NtrC family response regulator